MKTPRRILSRLLCVLLLALLPLRAAEARKPNVIVFLSDDVGYGEYGFQGNKEIPTPISIPSPETASASGKVTSPGRIAAQHARV